MNTRKTLLIATLIVLPTVRGREIHAQSLELTLARLGSSKTDTAKESALYALLKLGAKEQFPVCSSNATIQIRQALITALEKENDLFQAGNVSSGSQGYSETETEYYANLISDVLGI